MLLFVLLILFLTLTFQQKSQAIIIASYQNFWKNSTKLWKCAANYYIDSTILLWIPPFNPEFPFVHNLGGRIMTFILHTFCFNL